MKYFIILLMASLLWCCEDDTQENGQTFDPSLTYIRIENVSKFTFKNLEVNTSGGQQTYGTVKAGKLSGYLPFDFAHRYAYVQMTIDGDTTRVQPFDYVGESKLDPGKYTYVLDASEASDTYGRLSISLKE